MKTILGLPTLWGHNCMLESDPWPENSICYREAKKKTKEQKIPLLLNRVPGIR